MPGGILIANGKFAAMLAVKLTVDVWSMFGIHGIVMAGPDPAITLNSARRCHIIGIAGSSPAMAEVMGDFTRMHGRFRHRDRSGARDCDRDAAAQ